MFINTIRHEELRVLGPSIVALGKTDLFFAKRISVGVGAVLFVRRTVADVAVKNYEGRPARLLPAGLKCVIDAIGIVGIATPQTVPSVTQEPAHLVLRKGISGGSLDG